MNTEVKSFELKDVEGVLQQLDKAFYDIPFENSDFQNRNFVVAGQQTPARAYRAVGLRMFAKIRAVKEYLFQQELNKIDIEEKEAKINSDETSDFDKRRLRIEIAKIQDGDAWGKKLLNDALRELDCLYAEFNRLPKYTREQFELEERQHFEMRLSRQLQGGGGAAESLANMTQDFPQMDKRIEMALAAIENPKLLG
jgi:hypothetical protein